MIQEDEGGGVMVENRFKNIEENIRDIKHGQDQLIKAFSDLAVQAKRLDLIERDVSGHEKWLKKISETCISRGAMLDACPRPEAPQSWWDRSVSSAATKIAWLVIGTAVGMMVAGALQ